MQRAKSSSPGANDGALLQNESAFGATIETQGTPGETATVKVTTTLAKQQIYGPNTCAEGYVWRDADELDYVCVNPATREQAAADNAAASERHDAGGHTCKPGYVWREAFPNDYVCVTPATRAQAKSDNDAAGSRFMNANTQGG